MGSISTKEEHPIRKDFNILDYGYCRVWRRKTDLLQLMEQYQLHIESQQRVKTFENAWPLRTSHHTLVNVCYFSHSQSNQFCGQVIRGSLFTQRIPYRLSQLINVKHPQILYLMNKCIEGYQVLYQNYGLFLVKSTMIGFTQNLQVKIWLHTDLSQPEPQNPNCRNIQEMFVSIINSVESASENLYYHSPRFSQFLVETNYNYFSKGFKLLSKGLQDYARRLNITMPSKLKQLKKHIKKPQGWQNFKSNNIYPKLIECEGQTHVKLQSDIKSSHIDEKTVSNKQLPSQQTMTSLASTVKTTRLNNYLKNETNNRVIQKQFSGGQQNILNSGYGIYQSQKRFINGMSLAGYRQNVRFSQKNNDIKLWRSIQKVNDSSHGLCNRVNSPEVNQYNSPAHKMRLNNYSNEYYSNSLSNYDPLSINKFSDSKHDSFSKNSYDLSTDTRVRDKSTASEMSSIEDLQSKDNQTRKHAIMHPMYK